jgi:hypothetical protein
MSLGLIICSVFTAFFVVLWLWYFFELLRSLLSCRWPSTHGTLHQFAQLDVNLGDRIHEYAAQYSYVVDGKEYEGRRVSLIRLSPSLENSRRIRNRLSFVSPGVVRVYYHPKQPRVAVLIPGHYNWPQLIRMTSLVFVLFWTGWGFICALFYLEHAGFFGRLH